MFGTDIVYPIEEARRGNYYPAVQSEFRAIGRTLGAAAMNPTIQEKAAVGFFNRVLEPGATAISKFLGTYKPTMPASLPDVISPARWAMATGETNFAGNLVSRALPIAAKANVWAGVAQMMGNLGGSTPSQSYLRQFQANRIRAAGQGPRW